MEIHNSMGFEEKMVVFQVLCHGRMDHDSDPILHLIKIQSLDEAVHKYH